MQDRSMRLMIYVAPNYSKKRSKKFFKRVHLTQTPKRPYKLSAAFSCTFPFLTHPRFQCASVPADRKTDITAQLNRLVGHLMTYPDNTTRYYAFNMFLHGFSDLSFLPETKGQSRACNYGFYSCRINSERPGKISLS